MVRPIAIYCVFRWSNKKKRPQWELEEVVEQFDEDRVGRDRVGNFVYKIGRKFVARVDEEDEWEPVPGTLVYCWSWAYGTSLLHFEPPGEYPKWLNGLQWDRLLKEGQGRLLELLIEGSHNAREVVEAEAMKRIGGERWNCLRS